MSRISAEFSAKYVFELCVQHYPPISSVGVRFDLGCLRLSSTRIGRLHEFKLWRSFMLH